MITPRQARDLKARKTLSEELQELDRLVNLTASTDNRLVLRESEFSQEALDKLISIGYKVESQLNFVEVKW